MNVKYRGVGDLHGVRVSPHVYMLEEELARFVAALEQVVAARR
jgi:selenocysteine lyase/cysteine desulfurase